MSRLIVVSNRVPSPSADSSAGGLAVALKAALEESGGLWFGWSGRTQDSVRSQATVVEADGYRLATIDLSTADFRRYYEEVANRALWPLFHGRLDLVSFDHDSYAAYRRVNRRFAEALLPYLGSDDLLWIHDYHLFPLGKELRRLGVTAPIGFFLHIPFPPPSTLVVFPWYRELLDQLCAYDLVGFQTAGCVRNVCDSMTQLLGRRTAGNSVTDAGRRVKLGCFPIGIDTAAFAQLAASPKTRRLARHFQVRQRDQRWIVGVDRVDYTKGLTERFRAFELLLDRAPELRGRVSLVQVAAPSRNSIAEYRETQAQLQEICSRINSRHGRSGWLPIRYFNRPLNHMQIAALYRVSRVGLVTPLRDGMNLVAKEYVAAQDANDPGMLVLSSFAGAADELRHAVIVNPYDTQGMARALRDALSMPLEERRARWGRMMFHLQNHDVHRWRRQFLASLASSHELRPAPASAA